jgi:hypothetical protein
MIDENYLLDIIASTVLSQGLPSKYNIIKENMLLNDDLTFSDCRELVIKRTAIFQSESSSNASKQSSSRSALKASSNGNNNNNNQQKPKTCSQHPGATNHTDAQCYTLHPELRQNI